MLVHSVFFWLVEGATAQDHKMFENELATLKNIGSAEAVYVGTVAVTDRPVIDRSYDYALTVIFKDIEAHDRYQEDPIHKDFLKNCSSLFGKVLIYDAD